MQAFTSILGSLGSLGKGAAGNPIGSLLGVMGLINQFSLANKEKAALDRAVYYSKHPEAINALVKQYERPLSAGLTKGTENIVNASLAEQGLSQAPGIQSQVLTQALAPYQQNEQQMAIAMAMKALGLPLDAINAISGMKDPNSLALLLKNILPQPSTPTPGSGAIPNVDPSGDPWGTSNPQADTGLTFPIPDASQGVNA